jgi:hypothetical protein
LHAAGFGQERIEMRKRQPVLMLDLKPRGDERREKRQKQRTFF